DRAGDAGERRGALPVPGGGAGPFDHARGRRGAGAAATARRRALPRGVRHRLPGPLADCALRIVRLLETPAAIPALYPSVMREICYWLLTGPHGAEVARMTLSTSHARRVIAAMQTL